MNDASAITKSLIMARAASSSRDSWISLFLTARVGRLCSGNYFRTDILLELFPNRLQAISPSLTLSRIQCADRAPRLNNSLLIDLIDLIRFPITVLGNFVKDY